MQNKFKLFTGYFSNHSNLSHRDSHPHLLSIVSVLVKGLVAPILGERQSGFSVFLKTNHNLLDVARLRMQQLCNILTQAISTLLCLKFETQQYCFV